MDVNVFSQRELELKDEKQPSSDAIPPPQAMLDMYKIPGLWLPVFAYRLMTDPVVFYTELHNRYGDVFSVNAPGYKVIFLMGTSAYKMITDMAPNQAEIGAVLALLPGVGRGFTKSKNSEHHVQDLAIAGNRFIGQTLMKKDRFLAMESIIRRVLERRTSRWPEQINLSKHFVDLVYEAAGRCMVGDDLWNRIGHKAGPLVQAIGYGIDTRKIILSRTPLYRIFPEYRAAFRLSELLQKVVKEHNMSGSFPIIDDIREIEMDNGEKIQEMDVPWLMMYVLFNGLIYPGTYALWTYLDILSHPEIYQSIVHSHGHIRGKLLDSCFFETTRLHPVSVLARKITKEFMIENASTRYLIPKNSFVVVAPYVENLDPQAYQQPEDYNPLRYINGESGPHIFGRGAFGCVGKYFSKMLIRTIIDFLLEHFDVKINSLLPERILRTHILYPSKPIFASVSHTLSA